VFIIEGRERRAEPFERAPSREDIIKKIDYIGINPHQDLRFMELTKQEAIIVGIASNAKTVNFRGVDITIVNKLAVIDE
jgi:hypothetical protein